MAEPGTSDDALLERLVRRYQALLARLRSAGDHDEGEGLRSDLRAAMEELWPHLQQIVAPLTWSWATRYASDYAGSRGRADVLEALSTSMCMHILDDLTTREVKPERNLRALLRRIAKHRMIDEHRHGLRHAPSRPAPPPDQPAEAAHAPLPIDDETARLYSEVLSEEVTPQVDDRLFRQQCWEAIDAYWAYRLRPEERLIIRERRRDPPTPYDTIAALLTPPWSSAAVRKRFQRVLDDTRAHLRELGMLPDDLQLGA